MNLFDLYAKITLDTGDYEKGIEESRGTIAQASTFMTAKTVAIGNAMYDMGKKAVTSFIDLGKAAVEGYSEYEQLVGGVETLFKASSDVVQEYAANAYKTAGMSANEYMETVTSFSASLLQSLDGDTAAAAEKADLAITDMADNANKMGTSMESIQNAYQGFAKQNFTMLDNLKLGYGGTKEEMGRLLEDAEKLAGLDPFSLNINSFDDIVTAIHIVQTEMGITGTTAKEASSTIQGSVSSMKSAWTNLVTGIADENADLVGLFDNFVESAATAAGNLIPRIGIVLTRIGEAIEEKGPDMVVSGALLLAKLALGIVQSIPSVVGKIPEIVSSIVNGFAESGPEFKEIGVEIIQGLWNGITSMASWIGDKVSGFAGGLVDDVKGVLGIHSPSRVFAGIGENMALGLGEGWDDEYGRISQSIKSGLDFGAASVDFASSGLGSVSKSITGGIANSGSSGDIVINITQEVGGASVARKQYRYNIAEAQRRGVSLVNT